MAKKEEKKSTAIEKHQPQEITAGLPDYLKGSTGAGLENMNQQDTIMPRLGLCQSLSPQRKKSDPKYIANLEEGQFFNTITKEVFGTEVLMVPLLFYKSRILFGDMDEGGGLKCQSPDNLVGIGQPGGNCLTCGLSMFGKGGEPPECNQFYNYASLVVKNGKIVPEDIIVFSLKSSGLKIAREWNSLIRLRQADMFAGIYKFTSVEVKKDKYTWFAPVIEPASWVSKEAYAIAKECYKIVAELNRQGKLRHDVEDLQHANLSGEGTSEM